MEHPAPPDRWLALGTIGAPHGVGGWVRVHGHSEPLALLSQRKLWRLVEGEQIEIDAVQVGSGELLAKIAGCSERDSAAAYRGTAVGVWRSELPELTASEYYWDDLLGMAVVNLDGARLGEVAEVMECPANAVLRVVPAGCRSTEEVLLPLVAAVVQRVDLAAGEIRVDWPDAA